MRLAITLAALGLLAFQAQAQPAPATAAPSSASPAASAAAADNSRARPRRVALEKRFDAANTTKDGHLTKDQATSAKWRYVEIHFDAIDSDHRGYVTTADIRTFARAARAARKAGATSDSAPAPTKS